MSVFPELADSGSYSLSFYKSTDFYSWRSREQLVYFCTVVQISYSVSLLVSSQSMMGGLNVVFRKGLFETSYFGG